MICRYMIYDLSRLVKGLGGEKNDLRLPAAEIDRPLRALLTLLAEVTEKAFGLLSLRLELGLRLSALRLCLLLTLTEERS